LSYTVRCAAGGGGTGSRSQQPCSGGLARSAPGASRNHLRPAPLRLDWAVRHDAKRALRMQEQRPPGACVCWPFASLARPWLPWLPPFAAAMTASRPLPFPSPRSLRVWKSASQPRYVSDAIGLWEAHGMQWDRLVRGSVLCGVVLFAVGVGFHFLRGTSRRKWFARPSNKVCSYLGQSAQCLSRAGCARSSQSSAA
jgi:hypothetical protein